MRLKGFTLIEIVIAMGGLVVLAVAAAGFLFSILSQRDQAIAEAIAADQVEAVYGLLADKVRSAKTITISSDGTSLGLKTAAECWLIVFKPEDYGLYFAQSNGSCAIPETADERLTGQRVRVSAADFTLMTNDDSSRSISFDWTITVSRPLWQATQTYQHLLVNLVDQGV